MREPQLGRLCQPPPLPAAPLLTLSGGRQDGAGLVLGYGPCPNPAARSADAAPAAGAASGKLRALNARWKEHALNGLALTGTLACAGTINGRCPPTPAPACSAPRSEIFELSCIVTAPGGLLTHQLAAHVLHAPEQKQCALGSSALMVDPTHSTKRCSPPDRYAKLTRVSGVSGGWPIPAPPARRAA